MFQKKNFARHLAGADFSVMPCSLGCRVYLPKLSFAPLYPLTLSRVFSLSSAEQLNVAWFSGSRTQLSR